MNSRSIPREAPAPGVRFNAFERDGKRRRLVEFADEFVEPDWRRKGHIGYVLEGDLEIDVDRTRQRVQAGDGLFIPGGEESKHAARVVGRIARLILVEDAR